MYEFLLNSWNRVLWVLVRLVLASTLAQEVAYALAVAHDSANDAFHPSHCAQT